MSPGTGGRDGSGTDHDGGPPGAVSGTTEALPGPGKLLRWSVPASRGHDDLLISTALTARLDEIDWRDGTAWGSAGA